MDGTIIQQGRFTASGEATTVQLRSDVDWMKVYNINVLTAGGAGTGAKFEWMRGFGDDEGIEYTKLNADNSITIGYITSGGFTLIDTSDVSPGTLNTTISAISNAAIPVVSAASTAGLINGDVVRFINVTGGQQFGGIDFEIDSVSASTSFRLPYMAQVVAATTGSFREVFYKPSTPGTDATPRPRFISSISSAAAAVVELTVTHGYEVGSVVRMQVPAAYGMVEMDGISATITAVDTTLNTITIDVDSTAFTAFAFPLTAAAPFTPAQTVPYGTTGTDSSDRFADSDYIGITLAAGTDSPAGAVGDVIYWTAGTSFLVDNQ